MQRPFNVSTYQRINVSACRGIGVSAFGVRGSEFGVRGILYSVFCILYSDS
jgi:hypothetical protein